MPHKHTRHAADRPGDYDLDPSTRAAPLPARKANDEKVSGSAKAKAKATAKATATAKRARSTSKKSPADKNTPRAFTALMKRHEAMSSAKKAVSTQDLSTQRVRRPQSDDTTLVRLPAKKSRDTDQKVSDIRQQVPAPLPGERLADYGARVDRALPIAGLSRKLRGANQERKTRTEKRMQKMQQEWRVEDAKRKDKESERRDAELAEADDDDSEGESTVVSKGGRKARKRARMEDDDDPWAILKSKRDKPTGLHDVAQAPPTFTRIPKEKFKMPAVANVPLAAGSLRRREMLESERGEIVQRYRQLMAANRQQK